MSKKITNEEFIKRVKDKVGDEYSPLEEYKNVNTKILMKHNNCGYEWEIFPNNFLNNGSRCPKCQKIKSSKKITMTNEEFIKRVKEQVGNEYIPLEEYKGVKTKILMKHNNCGYEWEIIPGSFFTGTRCPRCQLIKKNKKQTMTNEEFIKRIKKQVGDEYTPLEEYKNNWTKILIKHNFCGHTWEVRPGSFFIGTRCPKCQNVKSAKKRTITNEEFIKRIKKQVGDEYYPLEKYINIETKILMKHNKCGYEWKVTPDSFFTGTRCPRCNKKKGENYIYNWLTNHNIDFEDEYSYEDCYWKSKSHLLRFDFRIPIKCKDILIEFDGIQHFKIIERFGGEEGFKENQIRDSIKNKYCEEHENIDLYRIHYLDYPILDDILTCIMEKYKEDLT